MKSSLLLWLCCSLAITLSAQSAERYIEFTVSDTIQVEAATARMLIIYKPKSPPVAYDPTTFEPIPQENEEVDWQQQQFVKQLEEKVKALQLDMELTTIPGLSNLYDTEADITIYAIAPTDFSKLEQLTPFLGTYKQVVYNYYDQNSPQLEAAEKRLFQKLARQAKQQATLTAEVNDVQLGRLISIKALSDPHGEGWTAYPFNNGLQMTLERLYGGQSMYPKLIILHQAQDYRFSIR